VYTPLDVDAVSTTAVEQPSLPLPTKYSLASFTVVGIANHHRWCCLLHCQCSLSVPVALLFRSIFGSYAVLLTLSFLRIRLRKNRLVLN